MIGTESVLKFNSKIFSIWQTNFGLKSILWVLKKTLDTLHNFIGFYCAFAFFLKLLKLFISINIESLILS